MTFALFQLFQIYGYVGNSFMQQDLQNMYTAVLGAGVAPEEAARNAGTEVTAAEKEYKEAYENYRSTYGGMYDNLDMMKILEKKQEMYNYHPKGNMQQFLEDNYRELQFRVEAIRSTEENSYGFYPGNQYKIHSILYGHIWKSLILEGAGGILHGGGSKRSDDVSIYYFFPDDRTAVSVFFNDCANRNYVIGGRSYGCSAVSAAKQLFYVCRHVYSFYGIIHFCL